MPVKPLPYPSAVLRDPAPRAPLTDRHLDHVAFPLGGLGAGSISLGGWGQLRDWEIRNRPAKGAGMPQGFFTLRCRWAGRSVTKVLQGPLGNGYVAPGGHSLGHDAGQGLPHFRDVSFDGRFPLAHVRLTDPAVPLSVELEAFNPFIPRNDFDSSLPTAILIYRLTNPTDTPVTATVYGNLTNTIGDPQAITRVNEALAGPPFGALSLRTAEPPGDDPTLGSLALACPLTEVAVVPRWPQQPWFGFLDHWWRAVAEADDFPPDLGDLPAASDTGTLAATVVVPPGATVDVPLILAWHFPTVAHWRADDEGRIPTWRNWYAGEFGDARAVAAYVCRELDRLRAATTAFRDALFSSTLPGVVLDAVSSQLSTLKTPTCLRLPDGTFYGFEGCNDTSGCCPGSCTHVWNYAQALPYLFPALQRSQREAEWTFGMLEDGYVTFRLPLPPGTRATDDFHPCADGQLGAVMQTYREWLVSGDPDWLKAIWPRAKRALEFAWKYWDADRDGVLEGMQHNTYDIEYYGPNTMLTGLYLGALRAAQKMGEAVGDPAAAEYGRLADAGGAWCDEHLHNGEYYEQEVRPDGWRAWPDKWRERSIGKYGYDSRFHDWPKWQVGRGCLADQLLGQWYAEMLGLGKLFDPANIRATLAAIFRHNWLPDLSEHPNPMRIYAVGREAGLLLCTWPRGERPGHPSVYADEAWSGIEYQVAAHLIYEGFVDEGLAVVKGVRDRYTGERRNPWDEIECGHHYVRSMASYSLLLALSGLRYEAPTRMLHLAPRLEVNPFRVFFSVEAGWGILTLTATELTVEVVEGSLPVERFVLRGVEHPAGGEATPGQPLVIPLGE